MATEQRHVSRIEHLVRNGWGDEDEGAREWMTAVLVPRRRDKRAHDAVQVQVHGPGGTPLVVGYLPRDDAPAYLRVLRELYDEQRILVACDALVCGEFVKGDVDRATCAMKLLLPEPSSLYQEATAAVVG